VERVITVPTTGIVGNVKRITFSESDLDRSVSFMRAGFQTICAPGDRLLVMMSSTAPGGIGDMVTKAVKPLGVETAVWGVIRSVEEAWAFLNDYRPGVLVGIPGQIAALAHYGERFGNPERTGIHGVLLSADDVPLSICRRVERLWNCETYRHYGRTEMGLTGGLEGEAHDGYRLRAADMLFEVNAPDADGYGEILITTLRREAMPLIRYRTGDIGKLSETMVDGGNAPIRIAKLRGRICNLFSIDGVTMNLSQIAEAVYRLPEAIDFVCRRTGDGGIRLELKTFPGESARVGELREALQETLSPRQYAAVRKAICVTNTVGATFPQGRYVKKRMG